ncbi:hypothetical protein DIURU_001089 [Diutina rugosa]|uniref:SSD domain-containing protein n=1 Tax=Diutina rugosa TaxID=5481 RepID=A0A642UVF6_DIURU|nr:uncharacterized protein DIURU_001089 [Diutina rugosa]KAA8906351.1 hypothetical protein DIURU_001089 [Diutina rugosa]
MRPLISLLSVASLASALISGQCAMYDDCGKKSVFGQSLPCAAPHPPVKPDPEVATKIKAICGEEFDTDLVCCSPSQVQSLEKQLKKVDPIIQSCPACHKNFYDFICQFTCSRKQGEFIKVVNTETSIDKHEEIITELDQFVNPDYAEKFYDSCKEVKFGATNGRAMDLIGGGAKNYSQFLKFIGDEKPMLGGSPFQINFKYSPEDGYLLRGEKSDMKSCDDKDYRCACTDCPKSCPKLPKFHNYRKHCTVGSLPCFSFAIAITWICLLGVLAGYHIYLAKTRSIGLDDDDGDLEISPLSYNSNSFLAKLSKVQQQMLESFENSFARLGQFCAQQPVKVIVTNLILCLIFASGLWKLQLEHDPIKLWVSNRETELHNKQYFESQFGEWFRIEQIIVSSNDKKPVLDWDVVKWWFQREKELLSLNDDYDELCYKPLGDSCAVESFTQWFDGDIDRLSRETWSTSLRKCARSPVECLPSFQQPLSPQLLFDDDDPTEAKGFVITLLVNSNSTNSKYTAKAERYERELLKWVSKLHHPRLNIAYSTEASLETELNKSSNTDFNIVAMSYLAMFIYVAFALGGHIPKTENDFVHTRISLALAAVVIIILSVLASAGLCAFFGIKSTLIIAEVIPFLILAIGVDNVFLLVDGLESISGQFPHDSMEKRVGKMLARVGPSCATSALIQIALFALATAVDMPAVRNFAIYSACAIAINFTIQMTGLVSLLSLDQQRVQSNRMDVFFWKHAPIQLNSPQGTPKESWSLSKWFKKEFAPWLLDPTNKPKIATLFVVWFGISLSLLPYIELGLDQRLALPSNSYLVPYFNAVYEHLNQGPPMFLVVRDADVTKRSIQKQLCGKFSGCDEFSVANVLEMEYKRSKKSTIAQPASNWVDDYLGWLNPTLDQCCRVRKTNPDEFCPPSASPRQCEVCYHDKTYDSFMNGFPQGHEFMHYFEAWISAPSDPCPLGGAAPYSGAINWNSSGVESSFFRTFHTPLRSQSDFIVAHRNAKRIVKEVSDYHPSLDVFAYSPFYIYFVQYDTIVKLTSVLLSVAAILIWGVGVITIGSVSSVSVMVAVVVMIIVGVGGAMAICGISLNAVSLVNLIICAGLAVEFCIHLTRAYTTSVVYDSDEASLYRDLVSTGIIDDPKAGVNQLKAYQALTTIGPSVLSGITTTKIIGIGVLAFTRSQIFEVYYFRMWASLILIASLHALVLLPVMLSYFGDSTKPKYTIVSN